jgi:glycosyltransferase involved in cell wall biosynthesis
MTRILTRLFRSMPSPLTSSDLARGPGRTAGALRLCFIGQEQAGVTHRSTGGIGNWMAAVTEGLAARGHDVHVVVPLPNGVSAADLPRPQGITVHGLRALPPGALDFVSHWAWPRSVARTMGALGRFDVVVAQDYSGPAVAYAQTRRAAPLVTHLHNTSQQIIAVASERRGGRLAAVLGPMQSSRERRQLHASDHIAGCSTSVLNDTIERFGLRDKPSAVVHSFVDVQRVRELSDARYTGPLADSIDPLVVFPGRLQEIKGVQELTVAMRRLWEGGSTARLVLAGSDGGWRGTSMTDRLRELAGPHADRVHHVGPVPHDQLFPLLRRAAVVAMPSYWEGLPLALLEAVALGCPVVTTTGHGADDVITDGVDGLLAPPRDDERLAVGIGRLLDDAQLAQRLGAAAQRRADYFDVAAGLVRFEQYYEAVSAPLRSARAAVA